MSLKDIPPQRDMRSRHQPPKPHERDADDYDEPVRFKPCQMRNCLWVPFGALKVGSSFEDSGTADETKTWRCPDCGAPVDLGEGDDVPGCCGRCGSTEAGEYR